MHPYEINFDFRLIDDDEKQITIIELMIPEYQGVRYHYHQARIVEEEGLARLQYGYTILYAGKYDIDVLNSDEKFFTIMGDILQVILLKKIEHDEQTGNDNSQEFTLQ
jgi:hypothetical protein